MLEASKSLPCCLLSAGHPHASVLDWVGGPGNRVVIIVWDQRDLLWQVNPAGGTVGNLSM